MPYALSHRIGLLTARRVCQNHDSEAADTSTAFGKTAEAAGGCGREAALRLARTQRRVVGTQIGRVSVVSA